MKVDDTIGKIDLLWGNTLRIKKTVFSAMSSGIYVRSKKNSAMS